MNIHLARRTKWMVQFQPVIETSEDDMVRWQCRNLMFRTPRQMNAWDLRELLERRTWKRINA